MQNSGLEIEAGLSVISVVDNWWKSVLQALDSWSRSVQSVDSW